MPVEVRLATENDAEAIVRVAIAAIEAISAQIYSEEQKRSWLKGRNVDDFRKAILEVGETIFVAELNSEVVGFASYTAEKLQAIFVDPGCQKQGIATRLYRIVESEACSKGIPELVLRSSLNAAPFYRLMGFVDVERKNYLMQHGVEMPCIDMKKVLDSVD